MFIKSIFIFQNMKFEQVQINDCRELACNMRILMMTINDNREYLTFINVSKKWFYRFESENQFKIWIEEELWTNILISKIFSFINIFNFVVALHRSLNDDEWNKTIIFSIFNLRELSTDSTNKAIRNYYYFEEFNEIWIMFVMF